MFSPNPSGKTVIPIRRISAARLRLRPGGTTPNEPPPDDDDGHKKRELNISLASVISSAVVAVASLVVSLVGQSNEQLQSQVEFKRNQQQEIYSDFIDAANQTRTADNAWYAYASNITGPEDRPEVDKRAAVASDAFQKLEEMLAKVRLVGSDDTVRVAGIIVTDARSLYHQLIYIPSSEPSVEVQRDEDIYDLQEGIRQTIDEFVAKARADLDAYDR